MKEWTYEEAVVTITKALLECELAKEFDFNNEDAEQMAREIATALEEAT